MVSHCARVAIFARPAFQYIISTAALPRAFVFSAFIAIVAEVNEVAFNESRFVDIAVTVVIYSIASLCVWNRGIAIGQALFHTYTLPFAHAEFVAHLAGREEPQHHRSIGAVTRTRLCHALVQLHPIHRGHFVALETPGTLTCFTAFATTKAALLTVRNAGIFRAPYPDAIHRL